MTPEEAWKVVREAQTDLRLRGGTYNENDLREYRDRQRAAGVPEDEIERQIDPLVTDLSRKYDQQAEDARYANGVLTWYEKLQGSKDIIDNTFSFGLTDKAGLTQSYRYQGDGFDAARYGAAVARDTTIMIATGGAGNAVAAPINAAGRLYFAYRSGESIGSGIEDIENKRYGWGATKIAAGVLGFGASLKGPAFRGPHRWRRGR